MQVIHTFITPDHHSIALAIGNFDGVHLGHRAMLSRLIANADEHLPSVMTFDPHPKCVFQSCNNFLLTDTAQRVQLLAETGIKRCWLMPFDHSFRHQTPDVFIANLHAINVKKLTVGKDFKFGYRGAGSVENLHKHFDVEIVATQFTANGQRISSSLIREAIRTGDFTRANNLLGREFAYTGEVIHGQKLGRTLGFPTANIMIDDTRLMPSGVFAVHVKIKETVFRGIANCGRRPTVGEQANRLLEVYLFDFDANLYGQVLSIIPIRKIRDERKFSALDELKRQIQRDIATAKAIF